MSFNDPTKLPMATSKRKAGAEAGMEIDIVSAIEPDSVNFAHDEMEVNESLSQSISDSKKGKRIHEIFESTENNGTDSTTHNVNGKSTGGERSSSNQTLKSRLQSLQNHNIMHHVMSYLDEIGLFQLENAHSEMIGISSIARQWSYLSSCDNDKRIHAHKRWRPSSEMDAESVEKEMELIESQVSVSSGKNSTINIRGSPLRQDLLARCIGRNFAEEAIFVREREKEASQIYDFDREPTNPYDIPVSSKGIANFGDKKHWHEWYDYRANSVNWKNAFVRLSLRDGSCRCWQGFRGMKTNYNTTFFRMQFNMKDLIDHMQWNELESYLRQLNGATYTSTQSRTMESILRMTQITVSLSGTLLVATGGSYPRFSEFSGTNGIEKGYFHPRHYRLPLAETTKNDVQWMPYRVCLAANPATNELAVEFDCDHADLPFMKAEDIGKPHACAHW